MMHNDIREEDMIRQLQRNNQELTPTKPELENARQLFEQIANIGGNKDGGFRVGGTE